MPKFIKYPIFTFLACVFLFLAVVAKEKFVKSDFWADSSIRLAFSSEEDIRVRTKHLVTQNVKNPASIKFPPLSKMDVWSMHGATFVSAYVDAQNDFGAMKRNDFTACWRDTKLIYLKFK